MGAKHLGLLAQFNSPGFSSGPPAIFMFFFVAIFVVIIGSVLFRAVKGVSEWSENNQQPVLTVPARMVTKREDVSVSSHHHNANHHSTSSSTSYFVTFEFSSGDRKEFEVTESQYGLLVEGDDGELTFQGTRYNGFQRTISDREKEPSTEETVAVSNLENIGAIEEQASEHSFCPYCGVQVEGNFKFCPHCGKEQPVYSSQV